MQLLRNLPELEDRVAYFVDNNAMKVGTKLLGKEIFSFSKLKEDDSLYPILICSMKNAKDIENQMKESKIKNNYLII